MKRKLLLLCFFLSGATGLVYEVLWTRVLSLSFGHTVWAITTVLAVFMGGLALGSAILGRLSDRCGDPVRFYAVLETGIGLYCLMAPFLLGLSRKGLLLLLPIAGGTLPARTALQFSLGILALIVPTTLMGGTLPAMARATIEDPKEAGTRFGVLYGSNTLGAALGAFAAGYWLLPTIGVAATNALAATVNVAVGTGLLLARGAAPAGKSAHPGLTAGSRRIAVPAPPVSDRALGAAFFLTGVVAMILQVAWVRALILVIGSSTYAYTAILVTFLFGIALGSFAYSGIRAGTPTLAAALVGGIAVTSFLLVPFFDRLPVLFLALFKGYAGNYAYVQFVQFVIVFVVVLVPTTLMGMTLPCLTGMIAREGARIGTDVGRYYALNTAGAILGSVVAGFVLIPGAGARNTVAAGIAIESCVAAMLLLRARPAWRTVAAPALGALGLAAFALPGWDKGLMNMAVAVYPGPPHGDSSYLSTSRAWLNQLLFDREGISSTVAVFGQRDGERWFTVNGKTDGGTGDLGPQVRLAMFPMLLHPRARRVGILGLGTGATAAAAGLFDGVEAIDVVELEPAVVEASRFFERENGGILSDRRTRLHIDDGRSFFAARRAEYDVIVSEPSNPWMAGVSNLYTAEFFREIRESLAAGGLFGIWVQAHMLSPDSYRLIARTVLEVFPDATLWQVSPGDTLFIGRRDGQAPRDAAPLEARLRGNPRLSGAFGESGDLPLDPLITSFLLGPQEIRLFAGTGEINTDDRNLLEFRAPRSMYRQQLNRVLWEVLRARRPGLPPYLDAPGADDDAFRLRSAEAHNYGGYVATALWEFDRLPSLAPPGRRTDAVHGGPQDEVREDFDGAAALPLLPASGPWRPDADDFEASLDWQADIAHLTRTGGVVRGAGRHGSGGLRLKCIRMSPSGYLAPLEVEPGADYEVRCWLKTGAGYEGRAGVAAAEYDTGEDDGAQPTAAFDERHLVRRFLPLEVEGSHGWRAASFRFHASAKTTLVRLHFFVDGRRGGSAVFDEIALKRIR